MQRGTSLFPTGNWKHCLWPNCARNSLCRVQQLPANYSTSAIEWYPEMINVRLIQTYFKSCIKPSYHLRQKIICLCHSLSGFNYLARFVASLSIHRVSSPSGAWRGSAKLLESAIPTGGCKETISRVGGVLCRYRTPAEEQAPAAEA